MKRIGMLVSVLALFVLGSCGQTPPAGGGNGGGGTTPVVEPQDVAEVLGAAETQLYRLEAPLAQAGVPVPVLLFGPFSGGIAPLDTATWNCDPVTVTGNASDPDRDGIPVDATYNGRCTWSYSGDQGSVEGYWEYRNVNVQDPNSNDPQAGVKVKGEVEWGITVSGEGSVTFTWTITQHDLVKQGEKYNFAYVGEWNISASDGQYSFNYDLSGTWTPDDPNEPWGNGTLSASGSFNGNGPDCTNGWRATVNVSNVHYADCGIDSGSATYHVTDCDGTTCTATVEWSGCDLVNVGGSCID